MYQDGPFTLVRDGTCPRVVPDAVDAPFLTFVYGVAEHFDSLLLFARIAGEQPAEDHGVAAVPGTVDVARVADHAGGGRVHALRAAARALAGFWRGLDRVDVVWTFGPHPLELLLVGLALIRRKRVVLGVRQDSRAYFRARLRRSSRRSPVVAAIEALDLLHRGAARCLPATVVGEANARRYAGGRGRVLAISPSLVRAADVVEEPPERAWDGAIELLTVGRIDVEKNPLLLVDALAALERASPGRYRLRWVGVGPLAADVRRRADELGVGDRVELLGYVPFGRGLLDLYRSANVFVHVSLTEGVPQVLVEAMASGTPIVATDVGGVRAGLGGGRTGLLVPPSDLGALTEAVVRVAEDEELRARLVAAGLELARERTLEAQAERAAAFIRAV